MPRPIRYLLPVAIMALLWWSSEQPPSPRAPDVMRAMAHNAMHVVAFGALAAGWQLAQLRRGAPLEFTCGSFVSLSATVAYGVADEVHQYFVPGRVASVLDLLSDASGGVLAIVLLGAIGDGLPSGFRPVGVWAAVSAACVLAATFLPW